MTSTGLNRPRIGIPWRTSQEEMEGNRSKIQNYEDAVRKAGGDPVLLTLAPQGALRGLIPGLDGFVLPGSPADVDPAEYARQNAGKSEPADLPRELTDRAILDHAFAQHKPILAICYGCQLLNVYLGGTLIQDLRSETGTHLAHRKKDLTPEPSDDPRHSVKFEAGSRLAAWAGGLVGEVNSSHHQSIENPGRQLKVTAHAPDGIVESIEWADEANWIIGVQWHPERMAGDPLAEKLFSEFVHAAQVARKIPVGRS